MSDIDMLLRPTQTLNDKFNKLSLKMNNLKSTLVSHYRLAKRPDLINRPDARDTIYKLIKYFNWVCDKLNRWKPMENVIFLTYERGLTCVEHEINHLNFHVNAAIEDLFN